MKRFLIIPFIFTFFSCNREVIHVEKSNETFSQTQKYQILCWTIKRSEGFRKSSYFCQAGKKTVGWGFTSTKHVKNIKEADEIFKDIVNPLFDQVSKEFPNLNYLQKAAITSLLYNTGNLHSIKTSKFSKHLIHNDINKAVKSFLSWNKVKHRKYFIVSRGLVKRRSFEAKLLDGSFSMNDYLSLKKEVEQIYKQNKS